MRLLIALLLLFSASLSHAQTLTGRIVSVADGDTVTILSPDNAQTKIRLYGIDTPEKNQPFGKAAKKHTSSLTYNKQAKVTSYDIDKYGRTVGVVEVEGTNINQSLIQAGLAWQYRKYCKASFCDDWNHFEKKARSSEIGLWSDSDPIPPWEWRKGSRIR